MAINGERFCGVCGSTLCGVIDGRVHGVTLGCVNGDPDVEIGTHIYVRSKTRWEVVPAGVRVYQEGPSSSGVRP